MLLFELASWRASNGLRAGAFVALAVSLTLAIQLAIHHRGGDGPGVPDIAGGGAAPAATSSAGAQAHVYGTGASAQDVGALASGATGAAIAPLRPAAFTRPIAEYRAYARATAGTLAARAAALERALRTDNTNNARAAWARADSSWRRVGAAYGALGALGDAIGGDPGNPHARGLRRVERGLWPASGAAHPRALVPVAHRLRADVARLRAVLPSSAITPLDYATRAHEILEDVQRDDFGASAPAPSDSGVRATADGIAATRLVLRTLAPTLAGRGDALATSRAALDRLATTVAAIRHAHGGAYPTVAALSRRERDHLLGELGAALQALSSVPDELETVLPPKVARIP
jgi:iron uptake system EfeUOB component EfeO/EfeM